MGYIPPPFPFRPNLDRFGLPRDYETYVWLTYGAGKKLTPDRRMFLYGPRLASGIEIPDFGQQVMMR